MKPALNLGAWRYLNGAEGGHALWLPAEHLVTHGVVVGMTGSGKTGLVTVLIEEAARAQVPTVVIDVKGDLPNLLLAFPSCDAAPLAPWIEMEREGLGPEEVAARAAELAQQRAAALAECKSATRSSPPTHKGLKCACSRPVAPPAKPYTCCRLSSGARRAGTPTPKPRAMRSPQPCRSFSGCSGASPIRRRAASTCC